MQIHKRSALNFSIFIIFAVAATIFIVGKGMEAVAEIESIDSRGGITLSATARKTHSGQEIDTSTWKTYRNEKYKFEVRYPESWETVVSNQSEMKGIFILFWRKSIDIVGLGVFEGTISADIVNKISPRPELKKIVVNGIQMLGLAHWGHQTPYDLYFERNGLVYYFTESFGSREGDGEIIEAIVSTFKFTK